MAGYSCKMCGGTLEITEGLSVCECQYCGSKQTLPKLSDEKKNNLYDRASHFRRNNEYDKAMSIYEQILNEDTEDAESYWSLVLCTYGIEYVEDPLTKKRVPTINRAQMTSIYADENYKSALKYADTMQKLLYEEEAKEIERIQKGIFAISSKEEPFDVFICYKESDANGRRTPDSVLANELYHQLTQEGFKVFFARITLEDKLGSAYEPYIFAALNSAKVMVVLGTKPEYFNAVWVRNEWSRYLALIKNGANKILIPAYRDMDPYDLPEDMAYLQAQDMSKLGFMQDLIRGIKKITGQDNKPVVNQANATSQSQNVTSSTQQGAVSGNGAQALVERAFLFLEDGDFVRADELCEQALNQDPKNAKAYVGKLMVERKFRTMEKMSLDTEELTENNYFQKAIRFAEDGLKNELNRCNQMIIDRNKDITYEQINKMVRENGVAGGYEAAIKVLDDAIARYEAMLGWRDSENKIKECREKKEQLIVDNKNSIYQWATDLLNAVQNASDADADDNSFTSSITMLKEAIQSFDSVVDWKDSNQLKENCTLLINRLQEERGEALFKKASAIFDAAKQKKSYSDEIKTIEQIIKSYSDIPAKDATEYVKEITSFKKSLMDMRKKQTKKKVRKNVLRVSLVALVLAIIYFAVIPGVSFYIGYLEAKKFADNDEYYQAREVWEDSANLDAPLFGIRDYYYGIYNDIRNEVDSWAYDKANYYYTEKNYDTSFEVLHNYLGVQEYRLSNHEEYTSEKYILARKCYYEKAILLEENEQYAEAYDMFRLIKGYEDSAERMVVCDNELAYLDAVAQYDAKEYVEALSAFEALLGFKDSAEFYSKCQEGIYQNAKSLHDNSDYEATKELLNYILEYKDSKDLYVLCENEIAYENAISKYNSRKYAEALKVFEALGDFSDSADWYIKTVYAYAEYNIALGEFDKAERIYRKVLSEEESSEIVKEEKYKKAVLLYENSSYDEAEVLLKEIGSYKDSTLLLEKCFDGQVECFVQVGNFSSAQELLSTYKTVEETNKIIFSGKYNYACILKETKKYTEALTLFQEIINFSDSAEQIKQLEKLIFIETLKAASDGSIITFGKYEQDGSNQNGKESIRWKVIAKENGKMLVISEYGLDTYPYNFYANGTIWSESDLHSWMNNSFYESAFSVFEKEFILETDGSLGKIFALNVNEAYRYMSESERKCKPTQYAKNNGAMTNLDKTLCYWWTRDLHENSSYTVVICPDGEETFDGIFYVKYKMDDSSITVRPAMWINLNPDTLN